MNIDEFESLKTGTPLLISRSGLIKKVLFVDRITGQDDLFAYKMAADEKPFSGNAYHDSYHGYVGYWKSALLFNGYTKSLQPWPGTIKRKETILLADIPCLWNDLMYLLRKNGIRTIGHLILIPKGFLEDIGFQPGDLKYLDIWLQDTGYKFKSWDGSDIPVDVNYKCRIALRAEHKYAPTLYARKLSKSLNIKEQESVEVEPEEEVVEVPAEKVETIGENGDDKIDPAQARVFRRLAVRLIFVDNYPLKVIAQISDDKDNRMVPLKQCNNDGSITVWPSNLKVAEGLGWPEDKIAEELRRAADLFRG